MNNPSTVLMRARQDPVPEDWRVFTKKRGKLSGFLGGTSDDPDPLLVMTPDEVIEYKNDRKPLKIVNFYDLAAVKLNARADTSSGSMLADLHVWVDLEYLDGRKEQWRPAAFWNNLQAIQGFIEAYGVHKALRGRN
ncbi:hypothetical protein ABZ770_09215 [Streptomyces sp. NPDC006654]|uniref:hypothetical protein n=1 Tax=Streptomyces sp. NPDC006654 TaxID=3156897 RepID=UPI0033C23B3B